MIEFKLEPVDALSLKWSRKAYKHQLVQQYYDHLDLSPANEIYDRCSEICNWYEEVVLNGKHHINKYVKKQITDADEQMLVLILSPGKSATALDLLVEHYDSIDRVFEIDCVGMDEKQNFYDTHYPSISGKIKCITAEYKSEYILNALNNLFREFYSNHPALIILENATHFLTKADFSKIVKSFKTPLKNNTFIIEHLIPVDNVHEEKRTIPEQVYYCLSEFSEGKKVYHHTPDEIDRIFNDHEGKFVERFNLTMMEKERLGTNKYFSRPEDGWIECVIWNV